MNRGNTTLKKRKETYKVEGREPARQAGVGPRLPPSSETAFFALEMPMGKIFQRTWVLCLAPMSQLSLCRIIIKVCWEHRKQHLHPEETNMIHTDHLENETSPKDNQRGNYKEKNIF